MTIAALNGEAFAWAMLLVLWAACAWIWLRNRATGQAGATGGLTGVGGRLRMAGIPPLPSALVQYWAAKVFCACGLALLVQAVFSIRSLPPTAPSLALPLLAGFFLPDLGLSMAIRRRREEIRRGLSFLLDLVVALLRAGLPLDRALFRAAREAFPDQHPLADEILRLEGEIGAGKDRGTAFYVLADRTGIGELRALAAAVHVGLRSGASVEDMLESQADTLRERRREEAIRRINTSAALSILPVVLCGLPLFAVVVYFPAFLDILETLRSLRLF